MWEWCFRSDKYATVVCSTGTLVWFIKVVVFYNYFEALLEERAACIHFLQTSQGLDRNAGGNWVLYRPKGSLVTL